MQKEDLIVGIYIEDEPICSDRCQSFGLSLLNGFKKAGVKAYSLNECSELNINPHLTISFRDIGGQIQSNMVKPGMPNVIWDMDSVFSQGIDTIEDLAKNPNFVVFQVTPSDDDALSEFYPQIRHAYVPNAVDLDLWVKKDVEKEYDIVFISSIEDYEAKIVELQQILPKSTFEILMMIYKTWLPASNLSFWQVYQIFKKEGGLKLTPTQYSYLFKHLVELITYSQRAKLIDKLQNFNVKVFGNPLWEKYVQGKVQYMGECNLKESIDIVNKSKILLHQNPAQLALGLHEDILNACATETFVLSNINKSIASEFHGNLGYYNFNCLDLTDKVDHYLQNSEEREESARAARQIVKDKHTWDIRAEQILRFIK